MLSTAYTINGNAVITIISGHGPAFGDEKPRFNFAEVAVKLLKEKCPSALLDGLVRVDFFQNGVGV